MQISGVFKVLEITRQGVTSTGNKFVHCSAISYDKNEQFMMINAFGSDAEFIIRNLNGARRAFVTGELVISEYEEVTEIIKVISIDGTKKKIKFPFTEVKTGLALVSNHVQFIDKKRDDEVEDITDADGTEEEVYECEDYVEEGTPEVKGSFTVEATVESNTVTGKKVSQAPVRSPRKRR